MVFLPPARWHVIIIISPLTSSCLFLPRCVVIRVVCSTLRHVPLFSRVIPPVVLCLVTNSVPFPRSTSLTMHPHPLSASRREYMTNMSSRNCVSFVCANCVRFAGMELENLLGKGLLFCFWLDGWNGRRGDIHFQKHGIAMVCRMDRAGWAARLC